MPYIDGERRMMVDKPLEDLLEWCKWNVYLMETRDETLYHIVIRILRCFYGGAGTENLPILPVDDDRRALVDKKLNPLLDAIGKNSHLTEKLSGVLNYTICRTLNGLYPREVSKYSDYNNAVGVLENALDDAGIEPRFRNAARGMIRCISMEYYRRRIAPYEQDASDLNGDIFE